MMMWSVNGGYSPANRNRPGDKKDKIAHHEQARSSRGGTSALPPLES